MKRAEKEEAVKDLHAKLEQSQAAVLVDYRGLKVEALNALRLQLRNSRAEYKVVKNNLTKLAAEGTDAAVLRDYLIGPCALAIGYDNPVTMAKVLIEFAKSNPNLEIRGGVLQGKFISEDDIKSLATLPGREVLLGKLLSVLVSPSTGLVQVFSGIIRKFLYTLKAIQDQKMASSS
ncbi:MAG: 50S ribosomal protein L10 [Proteobacteria bacterium]|nr:50S ribosomal protein L10 [Pseudomonadota bacterium]